MALGLTGIKMVRKGLRNASKMVRKTSLGLTSIPSVKFEKKKSMKMVF
jgi:hypothetical protein